MRQFMVSFKGTSAPPEILRGIAAGRIRAICLFAYQNVASPEQLRQLTGMLRRAAVENGQQPPLIGIDQEGGQLVAITNGATELPGNMALGATRSEDLAYKAGQVLGRELLAMGINMNFAPSLDVNINPKNPVIGIRSFGDDPDLVAALGAAMIRGMQSEGVIATAKHFPGHGDTVSDSHHVTPVVDQPLSRLNDVELKPFQAAIDAGADAIMTAHITFPALDATQPATLSRAILGDLLRGKMGFGGLLVTDAMDMHAVAHMGTAESVRAALSAGNDLILLGHIPDQMTLAQQFAGEESAESVARIERAQANIPRVQPPLGLVGSDAHRRIAQEIADSSITLVRDTAANLPLSPADGQRIAVLTFEPVDMTPADTSSGVTIRLADAVKMRHKDVQPITFSLNPDADEILDIVAQTADADIIIIGTARAEHYPGQGELVAALSAQNKPLITVALRTPYDILAYPQVATYLCAYGIRDVTTEAVARVLFGEIAPQGTLPCQGFAEFL